MVAVGKNLDQARSVVESLEEWSKVLTVCRIFNKKMDDASKQAVETSMKSETKAILFVKKKSNQAVIGN